MKATWLILAGLAALTGCRAPAARFAALETSPDEPAHQRVQLVQARLQPSPQPANRVTESVPVAPAQAQPSPQPQTTEMPAPPAPATAAPAIPAPANVPFTSPSPQFRNLGAAVLAGAIATSPALTDDAARQRVESLVFGAMGPAGRLGATAPPTALAGAVLSRPGIQRGPATGLGFGSPRANVFTPRVNRLSGPNGRCQDLARAGFFGGSRRTCESSFRRR